AVLGAMLRWPEAADEATALLTAGDFATDAHQKLFAAIVALGAEAKPVDAVSVADELHRRGHVQDVRYPYLAELLEAATVVQNVSYHAQRVKDASLLRQLDVVGQRIVEAARRPSGSAREALEEAEREIFALNEAAQAVATDRGDGSVTAHDVFRYVDDCHANRGRTRGLSTGFMDLDDKLGGGFRPS